MNTGRREKSRGEELASSISHGVGLTLAVAGSPFLIAQAVRRGDAGLVVGVSIFAATMIALYLISTLYHAVPGGRKKRGLRVLDHSAIFLLIAGTYTPFTLGVLGGPWGWSLFGTVWGLAAIGIALKVLGGIPHPVVSVALYLLMGWLVVVAVYPLYLRMPAPGLLLLVSGGVAYTGGLAFFAAEPRLRYSHFIWHLFVISGTACHYFAILWWA